MKTVPFTYKHSAAPTYLHTPHWIYFIAKNWFMIVLCITGLVVAGLNPAPLSNPLFWIALFCSVVLAYQFIALRMTEFEIAPEQIRIITGIFNRDIDHIELYRVYDYKTRKPFLMRLFGLENICIYSGDRTRPILLIPGVKQSDNLVAIIRQRVEQQKQIKHIYEISNR